MDHQQQNNPIIQSPAIKPPWADDDHQLFLMAVVNVPEDSAERWQKIADGVPGKTADEVKAYYGVLEHELKEIEAGRVELPHYPEDDNNGVGVGVGVGDEVWVSSDGELRTSRISVVCNRVGKDRKKGNPWTIEEHRKFLEGLEKYGKGDWRNIARTMVVTRTATQVASHAQKYFLRQKAEKKQKKRSSIHDITTTTTTATTTNATATTTNTTTNTTTAMVVHEQPATSPPTQPETPPATAKTGEPAPPTSSPPGFSGGQSPPPLPPHNTGIFYDGQPPSPLTFTLDNFFCGGGSGGPPPLTPEPVNYYGGDGGEMGGAPLPPLSPFEFCWDQGVVSPSSMDIQFQDYMYYSSLS